MPMNMTVASTKKSRMELFAIINTYNVHTQTHRNVEAESLCLIYCAMSTKECVLNGTSGIRLLENNETQLDEHRTRPRK